MSDSGFYSDKISQAWVFAYDAAAGDSVWIRTGITTPSPIDLSPDDEPEAHWQLPSNPIELREFCVKYGFKRLTTHDAHVHMERYLGEAAALLDPHNNAELWRSTAKAVEFVRCVKNFLMDLEEI